MHISLEWGGLTHRGRESLPHREGPLLTSENSQAQRWARLVQAAFGSPVPSVMGPPPTPFPLCYPDLGLYAAPAGEAGGSKDVQQALGGSGLTALKLGLELASSSQCYTLVMGHANMRFHGEPVVCVCFRPECKKG